MIAIEDIKKGLKFKRNRGRKTPKIETLTDIYRTYNDKGELVKTRYVATHDFMGQKITDYDIVLVSIQRAEIIK